MIGIKTHLCLVSNQPAPNLVPACDTNFKPENTILMVSKDMQNHAFNLEVVLKERGVNCSQLHIDDAFDPIHIREKVLQFFEENPSDKIALNATGGTKIMATATYQVFIEKGLPAFCVHPEKDQIIWLQPDQSAMEISDTVSLPEFFRTHGFIIKSLKRDKANPAFLNLAQNLIAGIEKYQAALSYLNFLAGTAKRSPSLKSNPIRENDLKRQDFKDLLNIFEQNNLLRIIAGVVEFSSEDARFFTNGGWLEHYVYNIVLQLKDRLKIRDCAMGVEISSSSGTPNEIDVAFLWNNRLHMIECKTRRFRDIDPEIGPGAETLYKMDTLRDYGGLQTKSLLTSYKDLPKWDLLRAQDLGIKTLVGPALRNLEFEILQWINR